MKRGSLPLSGRRLRNLRQEQHLTVRELAAVVGVSEATISRYENGIVEPKRTMVESLARYFGVSPAWLMAMPEAEQRTQLNDTKGKRIPVLGSIAAGKPIFAEENIEEYKLVGMDACVHFCLRVKGDSMINARIMDGDLVFIRKQETVENGEVAAVLIDDEATLKRFYKLDGSVVLRSENPKYPETILQRRDAKKINVLGKAVFFCSEV